MATQTHSASSLYPLIYSFLTANGLTETASQFRRETQLSKKAAVTDEDIVAIYNEYKARQEHRSKRTLENGSDVPAKRARAHSDDETGESRVTKSSEKNKTPSTKPSHSLKALNSAADASDEPAPQAVHSKGKTKAVPPTTSESKVKHVEADDKDAEESDSEEAPKKVNAKKPSTASTMSIMKPDTEGEKNPTPVDEVDKSEKTPGKGNKGKQPGIPFRRVKVEEAVYDHDALKDNSYLRIAEAGNDFGMKAHSVLSVEKGKGFRTNKNKLKKKSYRGSIDINAQHSFKFDNSDDEG